MQIKCHDKKVQYFLATIINILLLIKILYSPNPCNPENAFVEGLILFLTVSSLLYLIVFIWNINAYYSYVEESDIGRMSYEAFQCFMTFLLLLVIAMFLLGFLGII